MMDQQYQVWLEKRDYAAGTVQAQMHRARRVEECYGDLDGHYGRDQLASVIGELRYSTEDERRNKPNPSKIPFNGKIRTNLASYKDAMERYCKFRRQAIDEEGFAESPIAPMTDAEDVVSGQLIGLERDMQTALRRTIEQLEQGLEITDDGAERSVSSGFIDITAKDANGSTVVVELKTGTAGQRAVAQILSYMGDVAMDEPDVEVRGILVAGGFDRKSRAAARVVPTLSLREYKVKFEFMDANEASV